MKKQVYQIYIDGSYHYKSQTGGWGFVVLKDMSVLDQSYGQVPDIHKYQFENYAFAKAIEYCANNKFENVTVYTDALDLERKTKDISISELQNKVKEFIPDFNSNLLQLNLEIKHVIRKNNKDADVLSRKYLIELLEKEKSEIAKVINTNPKIEFFKTNKFVFCCQSMIKSAERRVIRAVKYKSLIIEIGQYYKNKKSFIKVMYFKNNQYQILEEFFISEENEKKELINICKKYFKNHKKILLSISAKKTKLYNEVIGLEASGKDSFKKELDSLLYMIDDLFVYEKNFTWTDKEMKPKLKLFSFDEKKSFYKDKASSSEKALNKLIGFNILEFKKLHKRNPDLNERANLKEKVLNDLKKLKPS